MGGRGEQPPPSRAAGQPLPRPTISLPSRTSMESLFNGGLPAGGGFGFSPGPMTLVSSFFSDNDDYKSFSQLLAGAMPSPVANSVEGGSFKQNRPSGLAIVHSPMFTVPPGLSPPGFLDSPGLFSPTQAPFGMTHQQALVQVTAQAVQAQSNVHMQAERPSSVSAAPATSLLQVPSSTSHTSSAQQLMPLSMPESGAALKESHDYSHSDEQKLHSSSLNVDKPAEDGYNWRKYGQKQVKGSEFPRSYYKCTHPNCPVKKKVERSLDGHVTAIIYKGQHNHQPPQSKKRAKDAAASNENSSLQGNLDATYQVLSGSLKDGITFHSMATMELESSQATAENLSGSDIEEVGDQETEVEEKNDEPDPKRRNTEVTVPETASSHSAVTESKIIVQTTSEVDLLDDGYRWRKYGQKVVKGNPYPRSYYKCTTPGCNVRKHVERASTDPKAVITTYEGKHNHNVPAAKTNSHTLANNTASQIKPHNAVTQNHGSSTRDLGSNDHQPVARLRLKEEQIT
ncbi:hypothetical protein L6164_027053 [Bauhinia variegata]|uniref:Uncharacterized protein n=1 Tax=Bauhinia variegata TaxID=167791 RepID=A0ACB9LRU3_BAUVA|nr:hypothetical protein L6164_027053 [Bauhinia variegata]